MWIGESVVVLKMMMFAATSVLLSSAANALNTPSTLSRSDSLSQQPPPTLALPDNPSLWRVMLYKTGQGLSKTGAAIEHGAEKSSQAIGHSGQIVGGKLEQSAARAGGFVQDKSQQTTDFVRQNGNKVNRS
jgi:hypothetical protein